MEPISREQLKYRLEREGANNADRVKGFALVSVVDHARFTRKRIPGSTNIPVGSEHEYEKRYDRIKSIVLYADSSDSGRAQMVAALLAQRGFRYVSVYEGGINDWQAAGFKLQTESDTFESVEMR